MTTPKIIACVRMWEETGSGKYHDIAQNFWDIVTGHHVYVIGGVGNYEHFQAPDVVAGAAVNFTCENCVSYNMLKLTRLLHFHQLTRVDMIDYYERTLFNQMLGEQDPTSPHGFNCYYTGLSAGAFKRQPLNYFPRRQPRTSTPPTRTPSPATPPPGWRPRPSSPTPSTPATRTASTSTCSSRRRSGWPGWCWSRRPASPTTR